MLHPIGSRAPAIYWRRRLALFAALLGLIVLTAWVLRDGGGKNNAAATAPSSTHTSHEPQSGATKSRPTQPASSGTTSGPASSGAASTPGGPAVPAACAPAALKVAAVVGRSTYSVGQQPMVLLQVTNAGKVPCVQDLADSQVELRVYNGESRVWGSHDCTIEPGVTDRTLAVGKPVRVSIVWSGLSSQPKCAGTRQRVGAGTYTLYALLAGHQGTAAQFSIR